MVETVSDAALAASLVREAGVLAARMRAGDDLEVARKTSVSDIVSAADHAAEELVVSRLDDARPADGIIGEEGASRPSSSGRTWHLDPVDGTYNFVAGIPVWCSAAALVDDASGDVLVGAVYHPASDELWLGGRDLPTTRNGVEVPAVTDAPLASLSVASYLHPSTMADAGLQAAWVDVISRAATVRMLGSGSVELAAVAAGRLGCWIQHDSLSWDWLPGSALVRAAGGTTAEIEVGGHVWRAAGPATAVAEAVRVLAAH
ncbi:inositol monophosphatase family protein [Jatrophihabitans sp. YIM 134969]